MPIALNMIMKKIVVFLIQNIFGKHLNDDDDDDDLYFIQFVDFVDFVY
jgi:hypothetical protein